jgi:PAS domain S-box-containing protein
VERDEALRRLQDTEERLRLALAAGDIGIWEWYPQSGTFIWDEWLYSLWGVNPSEAPTYELFMGAIVSDDRPLVQAAIDRALDPASGGHYEAFFRLGNDEHVRWVRARGRCTFDEQRRPGRFVGTILDLTDRERLREAAQAHARRAEAWGSLASRLLHARSLDDKLRAICEEVVAAFGVTMAAVYLMDEQVEESFCAHVHGVPPGVVLQSVPAAAMRARVARYGHIMQIPDIPQASGLPNQEVMVRGHVRSLASVDLLFEGKYLGSVVVANHHRMRRFTGEEMAFLQTVADLASVAVHNFSLADRQQKILSAMAEGVTLAERSGRIVFVNAACEAMLGYGAGELIGTSIEELWFPDDRAARSARWARLVPEGAPERWIARYRTRGGREVWASVVEIAMRDGGLSSGVLSVITDVTEARKLEAKVQHAQKLESLGVLAGGIAHDFNNLLVGILGNAGLALDELRDEAPAREQLADIQTAAIRASELTRQLLAYAGKGRFVIGRIDLRRLVEEMGHLLAAVIPKNVIIKYSFAAHLPLIEGDATQLRQVVMNLITNAADAVGKRSGIITVSTSLIEADPAYLADTLLDEGLPGGYYVSLEVSDTGVGMSPETRARIFDPFFTTKFTGRGLGLAAVLGILRSHRAAIKVYSEEGRGSTFRVLFPAVEGAADALRGATGPSEGWRGTGTILVVDDDESVRTVAKRILERTGFRVLVAADGVEGVTMFRAYRGEIRAVLLDVTMPRMGGEEAFRQLRQIAPDVRVLLSSGYSEHEATSRFAGKGLAGFVEKPFTPPELVEHLRAVLEAPDRDRTGKE